MTWECAVCGGEHPVEEKTCPYNINRPWPNQDCSCLRCQAVRLMAKARRLERLDRLDRESGKQVQLCPVSKRNPQQECSHCGLSGHSAQFCLFLDRNGRALKEHGIWELKERRFVASTELAPIAGNAHCAPPALCWLCLKCGERFVTQRNPYCCPRCGHVIDNHRTKNVVTDPDLAAPRFEHAGCQEGCPPGSLPSLEPPAGGRPAEPASGGPLAPEPTRPPDYGGFRPLDLSCWEVSVAADRLRRAGKKEEHVRRLFCTMIEAVFLCGHEDEQP